MMNRYQNKPSIWFVIIAAIIFGGLIGSVYLFPLTFDDGIDFNSAISSFVSFILCLSLFGYFMAPLSKIQIIYSSLVSGAVAGIVWWTFSSNAPQSPLLPIVVFSIIGFLCVAIETRLKIG